MNTLGQNHNLWSHIPWSTASEEEILVQVCVSGETEVYQHWSDPISTHHDVLRFEVTVHVATGVKMV